MVSSDHSTNSEQIPMPLRYNLCSTISDFSKQRPQVLVTMTATPSWICTILLLCSPHIVYSHTHTHTPLATDLASTDNDIGMSWAVYIHTCTCTCDWGILYYLGGSPILWPGCPYTCIYCHMYNTTLRVCTDWPHSWHSSPKRLPLKVAVLQCRQWQTDG